MCSASRECMSRCAEAFNWPEFSSEQKKIALECVLHHIFHALIEDIENNFPPGWQWIATPESELDNWRESFGQMRDLDLFWDVHHTDRLREIVSTDEAIGDGNKTFTQDENEYVKEHFETVRYGDYFESHEDGIVWVASEPQSIRVYWHDLLDESSIEVKVRNPPLRSLVLLAFQFYGCRVIDDPSTEHVLLKLPENSLLHKHPLRQTRRSQKRMARRHFLQMIPFLKLKTAMEEFEVYVDTMDESRPYNFVDAVLTSRPQLSD